MEWVELILIFMGFYAAYCLGHWTGYGKGVTDKQDFKDAVRQAQRQESKGGVDERKFIG